MGAGRRTDEQVKKAVEQAMSTLHHAPSGTNNGQTTAGGVRGNGRTYWRSLDEMAETGEFRDFLHREFPEHASELLDGSRRHFLKIMGASVALAGAATLPGCRRPDHKILTYNEQPEDVTIGKPLYYATAVRLASGNVEGVLAETFEGRPTKLEGNPLHPATRGKSSNQAQASILSLYDPDRDPAVWKNDHDLDVWGKKDVAGFADGHMASFDNTRGAGLAFLVEKSSSPSRMAMVTRLGRRWPDAKWYSYDSGQNENAIEGTLVAFGNEYSQHVSLEQARVILSIGSDFLGGEDNSLAMNRGYAAGRYVAGSRRGHEAGGSSMSRLYVAESEMTITGGQADHRVRVKPSQLQAFAVHVARAVLREIEDVQGVGAVSGAVARATTLAALDEQHAKIADAVAAELVANRGAGAVLVGASMPAAVHAIMHAVNAALGNIGPVFKYTAIPSHVSASSTKAITLLAGRIERGDVSTLVTIGCNPCYDAPADLGFAEKYASVGHTLYLGDLNETAAASKHRVSRSHDLESWGDVRSSDGMYTVIQPMIAPLYDTLSDIELLGMLSGDGVADGYEIVRQTFGPFANVKGAVMEKAWRRTLHDGIGYGSASKTLTPGVQWSRVGAAVENIKPIGGDLEAVFIACPKVGDGRFANNGWLQELPHPVTKIAWDAPALISPATADRLGITRDRHPKAAQYNHAQIIDVTIDGAKARVAVWVQPGLADDTIVLTMGYGRTVCGRIGTGVGMSVNAVRSSGGMRVAGASVARAKGESPYLIANTQDHWAMEGRGAVREIDLPAWQKFGDEDLTHNHDVQMDPYDRSRNLNFAGRLGTESHTPANESVYQKEHQNDHAYTELDENGDPKRDANGNVLAAKNKYGKRIQQWGMSIDLTKCTGCGGCTLACQAENNIPVIGKMEVAKGREMHWIRVDRYYVSTTEDDAYGVEPADDPNPEMVVEPIACMHCETAPCEVVCPVNATTHSKRGTNDMAYNRCIGTRYCSNNCPYKVRRFNYFDYGTKSFTGGYGQLAEGLSDAPEPSNMNLIPPRFREARPEVEWMQRNPHVTVRSRGVMEKCTYCIQRVNLASVETKLHDLDHVADGYFQTACQQSCPTDAIVFGDIYDNDAHNGAGSLVKQARNDGRSYALLSFQNTRPRTTFMIRLRNPNEQLVDDRRREGWKDPFHHGHGGGHGDHGGGHDAGGGDGHDEHANGRIMSLPVLMNSGAMV